MRRSRVLATPEDSISIIERLFQKESVISSYYFDPDSGEVIIEAENRALYRKTWSYPPGDYKTNRLDPKVVRTPPIKSRTVKNIREFMRNNLKKKRNS